MQVSASGTISIVNDDGSTTVAGKESYYNEKDIKAAQSLVSAGRTLSDPRTIAAWYGASAAFGYLLYAGGAFAPAIQQAEGGFGSLTGDIHFLLDRMAMIKPNVTNPELTEIVDELFQATDRIPGWRGRVSYKGMTGDLLSPAGHDQEAGEIVTR